MKKAVIGRNVSTIEDYAFSDCEQLAGVYFYGNAPTLGYGGDYDAVFTLFLGQAEGYTNIPGLTLYYIEGKVGWTSPTWRGYPTAIWHPDGETPVDPTELFTDIPGDAWYLDAVSYAIANGLMDGVGNFQFRPEGTMTRAMLVTVLWRYAGKPGAGPHSFEDVPEGQWYSEAVAWAAECGIVNGVDPTHFRPDGYITREQLAVILYRYATREGISTDASGDLLLFPDMDRVSEYAREALRWCVGEGIVGGSNGLLLPLGNATRAQVATMLMRFIENVAKS